MISFFAEDWFEENNDASRSSLNQPIGEMYLAQMAELVDALVSGTSA
jgi:hypothetical protein